MQPAAKPKNNQKIYKLLTQKSHPKVREMKWMFYNITQAVANADLFSNISFRFFITFFSRSVHYDTT